MLHEYDLAVLQILLLSTAFLLEHDHTLTNIHGIIDVLASKLDITLSLSLECNDGEVIQFVFKLN